MRLKNFTQETSGRIFSIFENAVLNTEVTRLLGNDALCQISTNLIRELSDHLQFLHPYSVYRFLDIAIMLISDSENYNRPEFEDIISTGAYLVEQGYWDLVHEFAKKYNEYFENESNFIGSKLYTIFKFLESLYLEKTDSLQKAYESWDKIDLSTIEKSKQRNIIRFYRASLMRLLGYYDIAIKEYEEIIREQYGNSNINEVLSVDSFYVRLHRQYADMLMLKGKFVQALNIATNLLRLEDNPVERAEIYRLIGHIFKFNGMNDSALEYYTKALVIAENNHLLHLQGELYVNLVEVSISDEYSEFPKAIAINEELNNMIEIGKAYSAYAVVLARLGDFKKAKEYADKSIAIQKEKGYQAGILFGLYAHLQIAIIEDNKELVEKILTEMENIIRDLNVYHFLILPACYYLVKGYPYARETEFLEADDDLEI